tara:strand:+ start:2049 stop:3239 length:1191 start_codon:yes stop_codon:yes gene_type:complete
MNYENKLTTHNIPTVSSPDGINEKTKYTFSITYTDQHSMDYEKFAETTKDIISREGNILAPYPDPQGDLNLRNLISERLSSLRGINVDAESIVITSGAGGAISNLINIFIEPNDTVLVEEFSYSGTLGMLLTKRANIIHIDSDKDGILPDSLEENLATLKSKNITPKFMYLISVFQNPTGITIPLERRKAIIKIAQKYNVPIIENESYADFRIDGDPLPPAMYGMDDTDSVMYVSAYTKFLGCGLRIGYMVVPDVIKEQLGKNRMNTTMPSQLATMSVFNFLDKYGYEHGLELEESIMRKRDAMLSALKENFPDTCEWNQPKGGLMIWLKLPEGANSWDILRNAVDRGVKYNPGGVYRADREKNNYLRLTYSYNTPNEIHEGIKILADVFDKEKLI